MVHGSDTHFWNFIFHTKSSIKLETESRKGQRDQAGSIPNLPLPPPPSPASMVSQVDADAHKSLAKEYGVSGFPTLKLLKDGKVSDYNGGRTADDIVKFVIKKSGPAAKVGQEEKMCCQPAAMIGSALRGNWHESDPS